MPDTPDQLLGPIIAQRVLSATIGEGNVQEVIIRMAAPQQVDSGEYRCYWEFEAPGYRKVRYAAGVDGFQAIHLATRMIGVIVWCIAQEKGYRFRWDDSDDLGFPDYHE